MKLLSIIPLVFLSVFSAGAQTYSGDSWSAVKSKGAGTLSVVYYEYPGLVSKSEGQMKGVCVDILSDFQKYVETKHGKKINIDYVGAEREFSVFLKAAQSTPNIVGVANTTITEERKKTMKFSPPFLTTRVVLLSSKSAPTLLKLEELPKAFNGFSAQVISGSTHEKYIQELKKQYYPSLTITYESTGERVIQNLAANAKIFSILDFTDYISIVKRKIPVKRHDVEFGTSEPLGFVMARQTDWDILFKEFLTEEYRKSVRYKQIIADNLGSSFLSLVK